MNIDMDTLTPLIVALISASGLWSLLSLRSKQFHERSMKDDATVAQFNETLREQVEGLVKKVDLLVSEKEALLKSIGDLKADLAAAQATIRNLEQALITRK